MLRFLLFLISFAMLVMSLVTLLDYWQYDETLQDVSTLMRGEVTAEQLDTRIQQAIQNNHPEDARMYLSIANTFGYELDANRYLTQLAAMETTWNTTVRNSGRFLDGFLDGEADSTVGMAGAITADFTVVGDVRDLHEQYQLYNSGQPVNELIVTLAGVGVGLTAATVLSSGGAAPAKSGASALKLAGRSGKLTPKLQKLLLRQGKDVFDAPGFMLAVRGERSLEGVRKAAVKAYNPRGMQALQETAERVNTIRRSSSLADTVDVLRYVESADDLRHLEKVSLKYGTQTRGIMRLLGRSAISTVRILRRSTELFIAALASLVSLLATLFSVGSLMRR